MVIYSLLLACYDLLMLAALRSYYMSDKNWWDLLTLERKATEATNERDALEIVSVSAMALVWQ